MVAEIIELSEVADRHLAVLFDTDVLIQAFNQRQSGGPIYDLLPAVSVNQRFMSEFVRWEFLRGRGAKVASHDERRGWLEKQGFAVKKPGADFFKSLSPLVDMEDARGSAVDAALVAQCLAAKNLAVIATINGKDFCWHDGIAIVKEFLPSGKC